MADAKPEEKKEEAKADAPAGGGGGGEAAAEEEEAKYKEIEQITLSDDKDRAFYEKIRRWKVEIKDIFVTASDVLEGFLVFTIGGDYSVEVYSIPAKKQIKRMFRGKKGFTDATEFKEILKVDSRIKFEKVIRYELRDSIVNLMKQHILIEVWEANSFAMNRLKGYGMTEIMKIIKGNVFQFVYVERKEKAQKKNLCKIEFKCFFQEIFDFKLTMQDWGASNLDILFPEKFQDRKSFSPKIDCQFKDKGTGKISADGVRGIINQEWSTQGELYFRGTLEELEQQCILITIISSSDLANLFQSEKKKMIYPLRGVSINGLVKKKITPEKSMKKKNKDIEMMPLTNDTRDPEYWGKININNLPKFKQIGFDMIMVENDVQVCILLKDFHLNYNSMFKLPESVFCTVEFNGKMVETEKIKVQILNKKFNQTMFFLFGDAGEMAKCNMRTREKDAGIRNTLKINNEAFVDIWLEDQWKCRDFLGRITVSFLEIFDKGKPAPKFYKDETFEVNYRPKIYSSSESFANVFDIDAHLDYEVWFYPEDYTKELNIKKTDKDFIKDTKIQIYEDILQNMTYKPFTDLVFKTLQNVPNVTNRFFGFDRKFFELPDNMDTMTDLTAKIKDLTDDFKNFYILDQFGEYRIINSYLSKLTIKSSFNESAKFIKIKSVEKILRQRRTEIDKVELGMGSNMESLIHYIKCVRFSFYDQQKKRRIVLSPDYVMLNRKGNIYEHNIYFACILLNYISESPIEYKNYLEEANKALENIQEEYEEEDNNQMKDKESDMKNEEISGNKDKNTSTLNLIEKDKDNPEDNLKLNEKDTKKKGKDKSKKKVDKKKTENQKAKNAKQKINVEKIESSQLIFICMGTLKQEVSLEMKKHMWIMIIQENFEDVEFIDPLIMRRFYLKDRIRNKGIMEWYFNVKNSHITDQEINKKKKPPKNNKGNKKDEKNKSNANNNNQRLNGDDDIDINLIVTREEDFIKDLDFLDNRVNIRQGQKINKEYSDKSNDEFVKHNKLEKHKEIKMDDELDLNKIKEFINFPMPQASKNSLKKFKNDVLPYKTIDVIFNKKNIWLNLQNHNPVGIIYDIYDQNRWFPLMCRFDGDKKEINHNDIPAFYSFKSFSPPFPEDDILQMKKNIIKSISNGFKLTRNQKNYSTTIKKNQSTQDLIELYLIFLEMYAVGYLTKEELITKVREWRNYFNIIMKKKCKHRIFPLFFNYFSETLISSYIQEKCEDFINEKNKTVTFMIGCKIFQYPNKALSVRILLIASLTEEEDPEEANKMYQLSDEDDYKNIPDKTLEKPEVEDFD